jgi:hypothetical protein
MAADESSTRRSVVPQAASRSLWLAAAWTGVGAALVGAFIAIGAVAVCWLPASGASGNAGSAIRAGVLTFLAALHGGVTVDGLPSEFVPLGMTLLVGAIAWRAGSGLADAAADLGEHDRTRLVQAAALQTFAFAIACAIAAHLATLGTSSVSALGAGLAGFVLFACTSCVAFVRSSPLRAELLDRLPSWTPAVTRGAAVGLAVYVGVGALLVAGSLVLHHHRVELLSQQLGAGWSGIPVLLLGVLAAPNAAIAGASYLAGPGFAVGTGSGVTLGSTVHGTLPDFPILGAVPSGPATTPAWLLVGVMPVIAGACVARAVSQAPTLLLRLRAAVLAAALAGLGGLVLAWQGGGAIGSGRLSSFGASPWQFGLAVAGALAIVSSASLSSLAALAWWRARRAADAASPWSASLVGLRSVVEKEKPVLSREDEVEADEPDVEVAELAADDDATSAPGAPAAPEGDALAG